MVVLLHSVTNKGVAFSILCYQTLNRFALSQPSAPPRYSCEPGVALKLTDTETGRQEKHQATLLWLQQLGRTIQKGRHCRVRDYRAALAETPLLNEEEPSRSEK